MWWVNATLFPDRLAPRLPAELCSKSWAPVIMQPYGPVQRMGNHGVQLYEILFAGLAHPSDVPGGLLHLLKTWPADSRLQPKLPSSPLQAGKIRLAFSCLLTG